MQVDEYRKLAELESEMWYFDALHRRIMFPLSPFYGQVARLLDTGCGTGGLIRALRRANPQWHITGLDFSALACSIARQTTDAEIVEGSITALPFEDASFEILTCADVLSHISDGNLALREFSRVLRPGGVLVINVAAYQWMWSYHDDAVQTRHRYRRSELVRMVKDCGLIPFQASYANMIIFPLIIARRKVLPPMAPTSDVQTYSPLVDSFCGGMAEVEYQWLKRGGSFPTGCSVFLAARKPLDPEL
ncbi:MAG: class I SAM-dependent methyltransferase [Cyanobacteriota bacterium]|jgi:SAM-dependent methyltransferase